MHVGHCEVLFMEMFCPIYYYSMVIRLKNITLILNQIINFVKSVFLRIREIKFKEKFVSKEDLYPGEYVKEIALNIIKADKSIKVDNFNESFEALKKLSLKESMDLIKKDLNKLGIQHDNFFSETEIVKKDLVSKAIKKLQNKNFVEEGFLDPPKGELSKNWKKKEINF